MRKTPAINSKLLTISHQHIKYHEPHLHGNYHWANWAMRVFNNKNYTLHWTDGASTNSIARTNRIGRRRSMPGEELWYCQRKCKQFVQCALSHSQVWVHWLWRLITASQWLNEHSGIVKQCHIPGKPRFHFFEFVGTINWLNWMNVMVARDHGRVTEIFYSRLTTSLRSLTIILLHFYTDYHLCPRLQPYFYNYHPSAYEARLRRTCPYNERYLVFADVVNHWRILSYLFFPPSFLRVSAALTVANNCSACLFDFHVVWTNPGTFGAALNSWCSGHPRSSMPLFCSIMDSSSAVQSSSLSVGLSKSPFQIGQSSVSKVHLGVLLLYLSTGWWLILWIWRTFKIWVCPPGRLFADKAGGKGDPSDKLNAAAPSCWKSDQDAMTICSVTEIYPTAVICLIWDRDSFWVAQRCWLPCQ